MGDLESGWDSWLIDGREKPLVSGFPHRHVVIVTDGHNLCRLSELLDAVDIFCMEPSKLFKLLSDGLSLLLLILVFFILIVINGFSLDSENTEDSGLGAHHEGLVVLGVMHV